MKLYPQGLQIQEGEGGELHRAPPPHRGSCPTAPLFVESNTPDRCSACLRYRWSQVPVKLLHYHALSASGAECQPLMRARSEQPQYSAGGPCGRRPARERQTDNDEELRQEHCAGPYHFVQRRLGLHYGACTSGVPGISWVRSSCLSRNTMEVLSVPAGAW